MLTDPKLRAQVDQLWDRLWSGGLSNPMDAIEQLSFLLFLKRLDDAENRAEKQANLRGELYLPRVPEAMRWRHWTHFEAKAALKHVREQVFPWLKEMGQKGSSFERYMQNAEFKISQPNLLIAACRAIDQMRISEQNQDVQGDLFEYLLSKLTIAGRGGQFRTPRHIIRLMVCMIDPRPGERMGDMAAGTCGFPVNTYQYILETHTSPEILEYDEEDWPHNLHGDRLSDEQWRFLQEEAFRAYDNDSGLTMHRIGSMNLMYHGIEHPRFFYMDTLSKEFSEAREYDVILMNPPFKGKVDKANVSEDLPDNTTKSELLFVHLALRVLDSGGRCAIIVPDGVLFGSSGAHVELRRKLVEENRLDGVVSMPGGVFKPYAGVSTAVLLFTQGAEPAERVWFYDMAHDGFSLDDKRQPVADNDLPDILDCWRNRHDAGFQAARQARLAALQAEVAPLKAERLRLLGEINRLTFESVIAPDDPDPKGFPKPLGSAQEQLAALEAEMAPLQAQIDQVQRQFWVPRKLIRANKYDLSASRYRQVEPDEAYYEQPQVTMERLLTLERVMAEEVRELKELLE
ncbi:MAG: SAM-dependent DNA methyltransferase [Anaerolineae bacterium]|nr:SAM-dependent DNA methyltransferase [Anaerolineae bacterium]